LRSPTKAGRLSGPFGAMITRPASLELCGTYAMTHQCRRLALEREVESGRVDSDAAEEAAGRVGARLGLKRERRPRCLLHKRRGRELLEDSAAAVSEVVVARRLFPVNTRSR